MKKNNFAIIIAGGKGERLWPLSTSKSPKPFINIFGRTLIERTYRRLSKYFFKENIYFIVPRGLKKKVKEFIPHANIITEPEGKNTAPACIYATHFIRRINSEASLGIFPADHVIEREKEFINSIKRGFEIAKKGFIITFGVKPSRPETGYGYVEIAEKIDKGKPEVYRARKFHEKPDLKLAVRYLKTGKYFWNSGMFIWNSGIFFEEIRKTRKELYALYEKTLLKKNAVNEFYKKVESNSIDYALLEYSKNIACCISEFLWEDLGSFLSFENVFPKDKDGNVIKGKSFLFNSTGNIVLTDNRIVVAKDIKDLVIIDHGQFTLIIPKKRSQEVKKILKKLKKTLPGKYF